MVEIEEVSDEAPIETTAQERTTDAEGWEKLMGDDLLLKVRKMWNFLVIQGWYR